MNRRALLHLPGRIIRRSRRLARGVLRRLLPRQHRIVFVFGGRTQYWPGVGRDLYEAEPVFRRSVQACAAIIKEQASIDIMPNFEGQTPEDFFKDESRVIMAIGVVQLALTDLWLSKGIFPNAVMGVSLGEVTASYATGALSLRDALTILSGYAIYCRTAEEDYQVLYVQTTIEEAFALTQVAPVWIEPIYEAGSNGTLLFCRQSDLPAAQRYFGEKNIVAHRPHDDLSRPYHTTYINRYRRPLMDYYSAVRSRPLRCDYYSCALGEELPAGSFIDAPFWHRLTSLPVRTHSAMQRAAGAGNNIFIHVGTHPFLKRELMQGGGQRGFLLLDSMNRQQGGTVPFRNVLRRLKRLRRAPSTLRGETPEGQWLEQFRFSASHVVRQPYTYLKAMQSAGPVHYLPAEGAWIVLDYTLIEEVLKQPQVFSSRLHQPFDAMLLGSDPPAHTAVRALLQPLFSPQALAQLAQATEEEAARLLKALPTDNLSFDLVNNFSLPLAQAVIARFLGWNEEEATALQPVLGGPVYGLAYLGQLEIFCRECLQSSTPRTGATALLLELVQNGSLQFEEAVRLLRMLWIAGTTTTSMLLSQAIHQLLLDPALIGSLLTDETLIHKFIEECLRLEAPESELRRITTAATELGGKSIPEGAIVMLALRAANRDPHYFENPDAIVLDRPLRRHLSFGGGYHYCLGVGMARTEARHALNVLLPFLSSVQLDLDRPAGYFPSPHFRGLAHLKVRRSPIAQALKPAHEQ